MPASIALVTRLQPQAEQTWLAILRAAMPNETIAVIDEIEEGDLRHVDIAIVANPDPADLRRLPGVRWIHSLWAGVERLVMELGAFSCPIVRLVDPKLSETMAEAVLAWTYYISRDMPAYAAQQRQRQWRQLPYRAAGDTRVGILGLGALGTAAAERLAMAGFRVNGWSRREKSIPGIETRTGAAGLKQLLRQSDIVVCLLPLTADTAGLLGREEFALLPAGAGFANFARAQIVETSELIRALDEGRLKHAVLDVFETEPLGSDDPRWIHPDITVLPHISAPTNPSTAALIVATAVHDYRVSAVVPAGIDFSRGY
jgi:glyoxylate/hydroxypyruvate reductase A